MTPGPPGNQPPRHKALDPFTPAESLSPREATFTASGDEDGDLSGGLSSTHTGVYVASGDRHIFNFSTYSSPVSQSR